MEGSVDEIIWHYVPLANLLLLASVALYIILRSNGWTGPALRSAIDQLFRLMGEHSRANKHLELELRRIERDVRLFEGRFDQVNDRITGIDEHVSGQLRAMNEELSNVKDAVESLKLKLDSSHMLHCPTPDSCPMMASPSAEAKDA